MSAWGDFASRLAAGLRRVSPRVFLIIASVDDGSRYVQFAGGPYRLDAEAPGADVALGADESVLDAVGWSRPDAANPNWGRSLALPALSTEYRRLADASVAALRDAYALPGLDRLTYRAWREPQTMPPGETWTPAEISSLDRGSDSLEIEELGLTWFRSPMN